MVGIYAIIIMLFGMYLYLAWHLVRLCNDNDDLKKENKHLEMRIDSLMECVKLMHKENNNKTPIINLKDNG